MRKMDVQRALIVTNRPAIANSWFDDYQRFIGHQTSYQFVSDSPSLAQRSPMTREQWKAYSLEHVDQDPASSSSCRSRTSRGRSTSAAPSTSSSTSPTLTGTCSSSTRPTRASTRRRPTWRSTRSSASHTLHLSGTPFKALASGRFGEDQIFNWTYENEQDGQGAWTDDSEDNPYAQLPTLNLLTYQLSRMVADRLAEGVALDEERRERRLHVRPGGVLLHQGERLLRLRSGCRHGSWTR